MEKAIVFFHTPYNSAVEKYSKNVNVLFSKFKIEKKI